MIGQCNYNWANGLRNSVINDLWIHYDRLGRTSDTAILFPFQISGLYTILIIITATDSIASSQ